MTTPDPLTTTRKATTMTDTTTDGDPFPWGDDTVTIDVPDAATMIREGRSDENLADLFPGNGVERVTPEILDRAGAHGLLDQLAADPIALTTTSARLRETIVDTVRLRLDTRRDARVDKLKGDDPTAADLRREIAGAADDLAVLEALGGAFLAGAAEAKGAAGDLLDELPKRGTRQTPPASVKAADGHGCEITVTRSARRELDVDDATVDDVLVADLVAGYEVDEKADPEGRYDPGAFAAGAREGIAALRKLLSASPGYRSTALDSLATKLGNAGEDDLAKRLGKAYRRIEKGTPSVKIERKPIVTDDEATS